MTANCCWPGGGAPDDPEGEVVLREVKEAAAGDPDIHVCLLPPFSDLEINALVRGSTVVMQKSIKEGFRVDSERSPTGRKSRWWEEESVESSCRF